jgi:putative transposase
MREPFDPSAYYHVYNRGVDKRNIFGDQEDVQRFYNSLYLLNDENYRHPGRLLQKEALISAAGMLAEDRKRHVSIAAFCLMTNHFHLLIKATGSDGISRFLHKLEMSYAKGFNEKYDRTGALFEGAFKAKPVDFEEHLQLLPRYIHLNALDGTQHAWRNGKSPDWEKAALALNGYRWSSHEAYAMRDQDLPVVDMDIVSEWFPSPEDYISYLRIPTVYGAEDPTFASHPWRVTR